MRPRRLTVFLHFLVLTAGWKLRLVDKNRPRKGLDSFPIDCGELPRRWGFQRQDFREGLLWSGFKVAALSCVVTWTILLSWSNDSSRSYHLQVEYPCFLWCLVLLAKRQIPTALDQQFKFLEQIPVQSTGYPQALRELSDRFLGS